MKKVISKQIVEIYCDGCNDLLTEESLIVDFSYGYGSKKDGQYGYFEFCSECSFFIWDFMKEQWPKLRLDGAYE